MIVSYSSCWHYLCCYTSNQINTVKEHSNFKTVSSAKSLFESKHKKSYLNLSIFNNLTKKYANLTGLRPMCVSRGVGVAKYTAPTFTN